MVELVNDNKGVQIFTNSTKDRIGNCVKAFGEIINCVMDVKMHYCRSIVLHFFLLDSALICSSSDLNDDNLFALSEVEEALTSKCKDVIISVSGNGMMERSKLLSLRLLTHWFTLFPMEINSVLHLLERVVNLYTFGINLDMSTSILDALEADFPTVERRRRELVRVWLTSSQDPPCWWHLVQALRAVKESELAEQLMSEHGKSDSKNCSFLSQHDF